MTIVSKDADFHQRSFLFGHPPKVIWVSRNCLTSDIEEPRTRRDEIGAFLADDETAFRAGVLLMPSKGPWARGHGV